VTEELRLERIVHGGVALARLSGGRLVLARGGIPGELVKADVVERSGVLRGNVTEVVESSADRLPALGHPGLDFSHIRYPRQLELKHEVVTDALRRALRSKEADGVVSSVEASPALWGYRNTVQPVMTKDGPGYRLPESDSVRALDGDPVANAAVNEVWRLLRAKAPPKGVREVAIRGNDAGEALIALIATSPQRSLLPYAHELTSQGVVGVTYARHDSRGRFRGGSERLAGAKRIMQVYGDFELSVTVSSFAQPNPLAAGALYWHAARAVGSGRRAVELFAGSGTMALHLSQAFTSVEAIEIDRASVARGREDAERLGIANVEFQAADARDADLSGEIDLIVADPPRSGLGRPVRDLIHGSSAGRLLYISCDPATWARDVADLTERGWRLELACPYDFYPHTHHVEMLSLLSR
jgi:23S rRNA (uracil1939-C5)-methyltransferase